MLSSVIDSATLPLPGTASAEKKSLPPGVALYLEADKQVFVIEVTATGCRLAFPVLEHIPELRQPQPVATFVTALLRAGLDLFPALKASYQPYTDKDASRENELYRQLAMAALGVAVRPSVWNRGFTHDCFVVRATAAVGPTLEAMLPPAKPPSMPDDTDRGAGEQGGGDGAEKRGETSARSATTGAAATGAASGDTGDNAGGSGDGEDAGHQPPDRSRLERLTQLLSMHYKDPFRSVLWEGLYVYPLLQREGSHVVDSDTVAMDLSICATVYHLLHGMADDVGRKLIDDTPPR